MSDRERFDVIVLGSGFGGSLLATTLCRQGLTVALIDRDRHPRFAIGESSTPAADLLLRRIAMRFELPELRPLSQFGSWRETYPDLLCGCKRGFSYFWHGDANGFQTTVDHTHELLAAANASRESADTQWYRPDVDQFFVNIARKYGVDSQEETNILAIEHHSPHDWTVDVACESHRQQLRARFLVDATGPAGVLVRRLGIDDLTGTLQTHSSAVYSHWENVRPLQDWLDSQAACVHDYPYPCEDAAVHHLFDDGWLWHLRFENGLTSVGFVSTCKQPHRAPSADLRWQSVLNRHPVLREILGRASVAGFPGQLFQTGRLQRLNAAGAGEDWAVLPHTVGFIDPMHSTGIAHTLSGVERLSRIIPIADNLERTRALAEYSENVVDELRHVDRLVSGCFAGLLDFRLFTAWSMLYFAAATTYESKMLQSQTISPGFLCADDAEFVRRIQELGRHLRILNPSDETAVAAHCDRVAEQVRPYNHVGLFDPDVKNMYRGTAI